MAEDVEKIKQEGRDMEKGKNLFKKKQVVHYSADKEEEGLVHKRLTKSRNHAGSQGLVGRDQVLLKKILFK